MTGGVDDAAALLRDPALGTKRGLERDGLAELDVHPRGDAPVVGTGQRPGHDLVEDRGQDPAVGDAVPPLESRFQGEVRPGAIGLDVQEQPHAVRIERAAREAVVRRDLEPGDPRDVDDPDVRRQGSAPCEPRS